MKRTEAPFFEFGHFTLYPEKRSAVVPFALIVIAVTIRFVAMIALGFRPFDDTYITFRYALNLATGHGFVYNWSDPVLGTTTPLWTFLLIPAIWLHVSLSAYVLACSFLFDLGTASLLYVLVRQSSSSEVVGAAASALFLLLLDYLALSLSGMECSLFVFLCITAIFLSSTNRWFIAGCVLGLTILTRPDGLLLSSVVVALILLDAGGREQIWRLISVTTGALIPLIPWIIFATVFFGSPIPQSVVAKHHWGRSSGLAHFSNENLLQFAFHGQYGGGLLTRTYWQGQFILACAALVGAVSIGRDAIYGRSGAIRSGCTLIIFPGAYLLVMGFFAAFTWFPWYYGPFYPFLAALAVIGVSRVALHTGGSSFQVVGVAGLVAIMVLCQTIALFKVKLPAAYSDSWTREWKEVAQHVPRSPLTTVAADEIGVLGWSAYPVTVDDLVGLVSPAILSSASPERYLQANKPDFIALRIADSRPLFNTIEKARWFREKYQPVFETIDHNYILYMDSAR